jgi:hypothetical protein
MCTITHNNQNSIRQSCPIVPGHPGSASNRASVSSSKETALTAPAALCAGRQVVGMKLNEDPDLHNDAPTIGRLPRFTIASYLGCLDSSSMHCVLIGGAELTNLRSKSGFSQGGHTTVTPLWLSHFDRKGDSAAQDLGSNRSVIFNGMNRLQN